MTDWCERRYYSTQHDAMMVRLSMVDERGQESYAVVPGKVRHPKKWTELRDEALDAIEDAIEAGQLPGEVML